MALCRLPSGISVLFSTLKSLFKKQVYHQKINVLYQIAEEFDPVSDCCYGTISRKLICKHLAARYLMGGGKSREN